MDNKMSITFSQLGLMGRLGNQMFQIASTIGTALKNNDTYMFPHWKHEPFFNLHGCFSNQLRFTSTYQEPYFHYAPIIYRTSLNLSGYFQSPKYWSGYENIIKNLLTPIQQIDRESGLCSIHVRRQDYINKQNCHPLMTINYYQQAMQMSGCTKFLILSDDILWCKANFSGNNFAFSEGKSEVEDLALMIKKCEHNIICNSTFSWWGAYLNQSPGKKVIAPKIWFGKSINHNTIDLIPSEWIKI